MRKSLLFLAGICLCLGLGAQGRLIDDVNPFVGTDGFGNIYPGAQVPFGGIQISPDTNDKDYDTAAGYKYSQPTIQGFSLTHLSGTGIPDLGDFLFLPGVGENTAPSRFVHDQEWAHPGYYGVLLQDSGIKAEMTAADRSGIFRFTYPASDDAFVMVDLNHTLYWKCAWSSVRQWDEYTVVGSKIVSGWSPERYVFFAARFDRPVSDFRILQDGKPVIYNTKRFRSHLEAWGTGLQAFVRFAAKEGEPVQVKVAVSATGIDGALKNLSEVAEADFGSVLASAENRWEKELGKYELDSDDVRLRQTFYTSVYHTALHPFLFQDVDGRYRGHDKNIARTDGWNNMTVFSLWDTYRAFHPLLNLVNRPLQADIANSMLAHFDKSAAQSFIKTAVLMDALAMVCNIFGQYLMSTAYMEQWYFWIGVNIFSVIMWVQTLKGASDSYAIIYIIKYAFYLVNSLNGLRIWLGLSKNKELEK